MIKNLLVAFVIGFMALSGGSTMAGQSHETEGRNKALVRAAFDAWMAGKGGPFELLDENVSWTIVGNSVASKTYDSREAFMREVIRPFNARMREPLRPTKIRSMVAEGDTVVTFFDARGVALDGKPYVNTYAWFFQMREGKVYKASAFFDSVEFNDFWRRVAPAS
jgi:uncharacterized protein